MLVNPSDTCEQRKHSRMNNIKCEECHVGETERSQKPGFKEHRRPSSITSEVAKRICVNHPHHFMELENTEILTTEYKWFERGVKEAIYIRALNPSLNREEGRDNLPLVLDNIIKKRVKSGRGKGGGDVGVWGGGSYLCQSSHTPPTTSGGKQY